MLKQVQHDVKRRKMRLGQHDVRISRATFNRHPELVSGSVRGEGQERARGEEPETARSEMLNQVNFVQFAHVDFVFLLLTRHSMQASSALVSFVGSA